MCQRTESKCRGSFDWCHQVRQCRKRYQQKSTCAKLRHELVHHAARCVYSENYDKPEIITLREKMYTGDVQHDPLKHTLLKTARAQRILNRAWGVSGDNIVTALQEFPLTKEMPEWMPNDCTDYCHQCNVKIRSGLFSSNKHHCRSCGRVICGSCDDLFFQYLDQSRSL